ncbi:MAG: MoaD/ThiS family protein [Halioglobus sp.]
MVRVLFFARVREDLACGSLELPWPGAGYDLDTLQEQLCRERGQAWRDVLQQENLIRAVNQVVMVSNCPVADGDEVAFFPPVTGG